MKLPSQGILIACEGIDGSGKSTLARALHAFFSNQNIPSLLTKEPGGTPLGSLLRALVQNPDIKRCSKAEFLLFAADRAEHFNTVIVPALNNKTLVISDRLADSSLVYQGFGRGLDIPTLATINAWAMNNRKPDVTLYVRISAQRAFERIRTRKETITAFEQEKTDFFNRLIEGFEEIYHNREDVLCIDGTQSQEAVLAQTIKQLTHFFEQRLTHGNIQCTPTGATLDR
jgi:dTMP kinase